MHFLKKAYHSKTLFMKTVTGKRNQKNKPFSNNLFLMFGPEKIRTIQIFVLETSSIGFQLEMVFFYFKYYSRPFSEMLSVCLDVRSLPLCWGRKMRNWKAIL